MIGMAIQSIEGRLLASLAPFKLHDRHCPNRIENVLSTSAPIVLARLRQHEVAIPEKASTVSIVVFQTASSEGIVFVPCGRAAGVFDADNLAVQIVGKLRARAARIRPGSGSARGVILVVNAAV